MDYARLTRRAQLVLGLTLLVGGILPSVEGWTPLTAALCMVVPVGGLLQSFRASRALARARGEGPGARIWHATVEEVHARGVELSCDEARLFVPVKTARWAVGNLETPPPLVAGLRVQVHGWVKRRAEGRLLLDRAWLAPDDDQPIAERMHMLTLRPWMAAGVLELVLLSVAAFV